MPDDGWKFVDSYTVAEYRCGLRAGQQVALRRDLVIRDHRRKPTGEVHRACELYDVVHGSEDDPGVIWLRQADGERCTWDDVADIFNWFAVVDQANE